MTELASFLQTAIARDPSLSHFRRLMDMYRRRRDPATLAKLDDHILRDIGLTRYDIEVLANS
jgi:uncharacterized protein YjiS (DUF1127 family)